MMKRTVSTAFCPICSLYHTTKRYILNTITSLNCIYWGFGVLGFWEKSEDVLIWRQKAWGPSHLKKYCWGPGKSIDTHIVGFCEKSADFWIWRQMALGPKFGLPGLESPQKRLLGSRRVHRHLYSGVLWEKWRFLNLAPKGPEIQVT